MYCATVELDSLYIDIMKLALIDAPCSDCPEVSDGVTNVAAAVDGEEPSCESCCVMLVD